MFWFCIKSLLIMLVYLVFILLVVWVLNGNLRICKFFFLFVRIVSVFFEYDGVMMIFKKIGCIFLVVVVLILWLRIIILLKIEIGLVL